MIILLESDILECEVKCALGNTATSKDSGGNGISGELFQILKDDATLNMSANLENSAVTTGLEMSVFISIPKKGNAQNVQTTAQLHSLYRLTR